FIILTRLNENGDSRLRGNNGSYGRILSSSFLISEVRRE
ncbi:MAG: hypothetical protein ACI905_001085, partial [Roseivirga sp.]